MSEAADNQEMLLFKTRGHRLVPEGRQLHIALDNDVSNSTHNRAHGPFHSVAVTRFGAHDHLAISPYYAQEVFPHTHAPCSHSGKQPDERSAYRETVILERSDYPYSPYFECGECGYNSHEQRNGNAHPWVEVFSRDEALPRSMPLEAATTGWNTYRQAFEKGNVGRLAIIFVQYPTIRRVDLVELNTLACQVQELSAFCLASILFAKTEKQRIKAAVYYEPPQ